jgi:hypothetical protein
MSNIMIAKTTKTLVTALVVTSASLALTVGAFAAPAKGRANEYTSERTLGPTHPLPRTAEQLWMNRASNPDTNGF